MLFCRSRRLSPLPPLYSPSQHQQIARLVNVRIKWAKDRALDHAVSRERHLIPALNLVETISSSPSSRLPSRALPLLRRCLRLPDAPAVFMRRHPALFCEAGEHFLLSPEASRVRRLEMEALRAAEHDLVDRLRRLLMLTCPRAVPLHTVDLLRRDLGLPVDYIDGLIPRYPQFFSLDDSVPGDERVWLRLISWEDRLAKSQLEIDTGADTSDCLAFPTRFTRGFGMKKKFMEWLEEWQRLPYTSPYVDASHLDPRTDVSEKRNVGVFHELLHLTIGKKTEKRNVSNMRKILSLPQKFTKVFERHPGIFYLSKKLGTQTVILREAYGGGRELLRKHPLMEIREMYIALMRAGMSEEGVSDDSECDEECDEQNF